MEEIFPTIETGASRHWIQANEELKMKIISCAGIAVILGVLFFTGCGKDTTAADVGEKTGAALDTAADKTVELTGKALDATGEGLKKAGAEVENTGETMQK